MRIVFMGTPDFAVSSLEALLKNQEQVVAVVTQPDRPKGRGQKLSPPPVKARALEYNLSVYQPENVNTPQFKGILQELNPDLIIVVAFGQLLSKDILTLPKQGCINVHASLLPKYRGAAPIHWSIINGEEETGITTMYMEEELDAGDMLLQEKLVIKEEDTLGSLHDKLAYLGGNTLVKTVVSLSEGSLTRKPQDHSQATYAAKIEKKDVEIDWTKNAKAVKNLIRGTNPWPGAYTFLEKKLWKIWQVEIEKTEGIYGLPGEILGNLAGRGLLVAAGQGMLFLQEIQPENSKKMKVDDYLKGNRLENGAILGRKREQGSKVDAG